MLDRTIEPPIHDAVEFDLKLRPCKEFRLDNDVPVYSIDGGSQDVVMIELVFYAGNWYEQQNMIAATANFMLKNGTTNRSAFEINEYFEFYGAFLNRACQNETATITLHCLSKHLPELLPVIAELLTDSVFPDQELSIYQQNQRQRLEVNLKKSDFVAGRLIDEHLYGAHHPYGRYTTVKDIDRLHKEQLVSFYQQYYTKGKCLLFVAGKLPSDIDQQINNAFGHLPFNKEALPTVDHPLKPSADKHFNVINDQNGVQGSIRLARPFFNRHHPDFPKMQVLNNIFGGYFGSRLMSNIREDKGYTYGIHSYIQNHVHDTAWLISTEAGRDVCAATIIEVHKEMDRLRKELVDADELHLVRNYMMGGILGDLDGPFQVIGRWKNYILNGLTDAFFYNSIHTIKTITAEDLMEVANKYFVPEDLYELVVI